MNVEEEVDECIGIIHPTHRQRDAGMKVGEPAIRRCLDDARDENGEGKEEVGR